MCVCMCVCLYQAILNCSNFKITLFINFEICIFTLVNIKKSISLLIINNIYSHNGNIHLKVVYIGIVSTSILFHIIII